MRIDDSAYAPGFHGAPTCRRCGDAALSPASVGDGSEPSCVVRLTEAQRAAIEKALVFLSLNGATWSADDESALAVIRAANRKR